MHERGRSRRVSRAALARQASEERRNARATYTPAPATVTAAGVSLAPPPAPFVSAPPLISKPASPPPLLVPATSTTHYHPHLRRLPQFKSSASPSPLHSRSASPPLTSGSASPDYPALPPSPPYASLDSHSRSLEDQLHIAYSLDDIHLAKIIYLKLKGISVTSHDDPRIAAVQPEDFDECFLPNGGLTLMTDAEEWGEKEQERREQTLRPDWERQTTEKWDRTREERRAATARFLHDEQHRWDERRESQRRIKAARTSSGQRSHLQLSRPPRLSYASLSPTRTNCPKPDDNQQLPPLEYDCIVTPSLLATTSPSPRLSPPRRSPVRMPSSAESVSDKSAARDMGLVSRSSSSLSPSHSPHARNASNEDCISSGTSSDNELSPVFSDLVPIKDVLAAMRGSLFPEDVKDKGRRRSSQSTTRNAGSSMSSTRKRRRKEQLLDVLLVTVKWEAGERARRKGKARARASKERQPTRRDTDRSSMASNYTSASSASCPACCSLTSTSSVASPVSPTSTTSSGSSKLFSRTSSWLSFASTSSSVASASTGITTPSTSPVKTSASRSLSALFKSSPATASLVYKSPRLCAQHRNRPFSKLVPIVAEDGPLSMKPMDYRQGILEEKGEKVSVAGPVTRSRTSSLLDHVRGFVELAKGFQNAYVGAVVVAAVPSVSPWDDDPAIQMTSTSSSAARHSEQPRGRQRSPKHRLLPPGYRATSSDVWLFLTPTTTPEPASHSAYIPLTTSFHPPQTVLQHPLPFRTVFKQEQPPMPSPLKRFAQQQLLAFVESHSTLVASSAGVHPGHDAQQLHQIQHPVPRARCIANPVYLRLKALQNVAGDAEEILKAAHVRDGTLGCGKEKLLGVAFEELGSSWLARSAAISSEGLAR